MGVARWERLARMPAGGRPAAAECRMALARACGWQTGSRGVTRLEALHLVQGRQDVHLPLAVQGAILEGLQKGEKKGGQGGGRVQQAPSSSRGRSRVLGGARAACQPPVQDRQAGWTVSFEERATREAEGMHQQQQRGGRRAQAPSWRCRAPQPPAPPPPPPPPSPCRARARSCAWPPPPARSLQQQGKKHGACRPRLLALPGRGAERGGTAQ